MTTFGRNRRAYFGMLGAALSIVAALGYHVICGDHGFLALRREKQQFQTLQNEAAQLQQANERLQNQITALKSDPKTIEKRAREDSLMAKPGEIIIRYSDPASKATGSNTVPSPGASQPAASQPSK